MIEMTHYDDGKEKYHSHKIEIREHDFVSDEPMVWSHNPFDITGYGATKDDAIKDFKNKFIYVIKELKALETMILDTDVITGNIIEVDCMGKPIKIIKNTNFTR